MPAKRKTKRRPFHVYQASEEAIQADIKAKVTEGSPLWVYLQQIREDDVGMGERDQFTLGLAEGARRLARQLQEMAAGVNDASNGQR